MKTAPAAAAAASVFAAKENKQRVVLLDGGPFKVELIKQGLMLLVDIYNQTPL